MYGLFGRRLLGPTHRIVEMLSSTYSAYGHASILYWIACASCVRSVLGWVAEKSSTATQIHIQDGHELLSLHMWSEREPHACATYTMIHQTCMHSCYTRVIADAVLWREQVRHVFEGLFRRVPCQYHERLLRCLRQNGSHARVVPKHWFHPPEMRRSPARWMLSTALSHYMIHIASSVRRSFSGIPRSVPPARGIH